jgi:hypothetical protein
MLVTDDHVAYLFLPPFPSPPANVFTLDDPAPARTQSTGNDGQVQWRRTASGCGWPLAKCRVATEDLLALLTPSDPASSPPPLPRGSDTDPFAAPTGLLPELTGAVAMAAFRARERIGAAARSYPSLRGALDSSVPNHHVAAFLGTSTLRAAGIDIERTIADALHPLAEWWITRLTNLHPDIDDWDVSLSNDLLMDVVADHVASSIEQVAPPGLTPDDLEQVLVLVPGPSVRAAS